MESETQESALSVRKIVITGILAAIAILRGYLTVEVIIPILPQAIFEMIIAAIITVAVVAAWKQIDGGRGGSSV